MSKVRLCDFCRKARVLHEPVGYKVRRDTGFGWKKIDICPKCWRVMEVALRAQSAGMEIDHCGTRSILKPKDVAEEVGLI